MSQIQGRHLRWIIIGWAAASLFFTVVVTVSDIGGHKSFPAVFYANCVHYALWALTLPLLSHCVQRFPLEHGKRLRNGVLWLALVIVLGASVDRVWWTIILLTYPPYHLASPTVSAILSSELVMFLPSDFLICVALIAALQGWRVWRRLEEERTRSAELERQLAVSRLEALRMQLHPHFLFNTLHTIAGLIGEQPAMGRRMVVALGDFLRLTLKNGATSFRSLADELEFMDLYLGIERLRLGDRLMLDYDIEAQATIAEVPYLLLQPLFENAIRHGAARLAGPCQIVFRAHRDGHRLLLSLENDGLVRGPSLPAAAHGVGLSNTLARLRLHYGNDFTFQYKDRPEGGVRIDLSLPYRKVESGEEQNAHDASEYAHHSR